MISTSTCLARDHCGPAPRFEAECTMPGGRLELKYCVPTAIAESVLALARTHLAPDALALGPQQRITSLYLDTAQLTFLRWHREGSSDRFKLRIRRYGEHAAPVVYAEVKRKTRSVVRKCRAPFPVEALQTLFEGSDVTNDGATPQDVESLREFGRRRRVSGATPRMLITCVRESLRDPEDGTAVTVDRDLRFQPTLHADLTGQERAWRMMRLPVTAGPATTVVELKYSGQPPLWMDPLIPWLAPWRVSFSKYATAMGESAIIPTC
jgi:VTC domain